MIVITWTNIAIKLSPVILLPPTLFMLVQVSSLMMSLDLGLEVTSTTLSLATP